YCKSSRVGRLRIIDLSSATALDILKSEIPIDQFNAIIEAVNMNLFPMSAYASDLSNTLDKALLSIYTLRETLYDVGYRKYFDLIAYDDANFTEITIRYFLDLMSYPNSPLKKIMLKRTSSSYLIIYLSNQLFIANNDIELGWLEREFYSPDRINACASLLILPNTVDYPIDKKVVGFGFAAPTTSPY
ncbi:hypothetical protein CLU79DRAFT_713127, partial [Phycomyces nitens]